MKKLAYISIALILLVSSIGCEKYIEGYDVDPNKPSEVTPNLLLSVSEVAVFLTYSGQPARTTSIWLQHMTGTDFQMVDVNNYFMLEADITNEWRTIYTNAQVNLNELINTFGDENPYYAGIAKVLTAMNLGIATDLWGDIPNREACKGLEGEGSFHPHYDQQQTVLEDIQAYLDEAIALLDQPEEANRLFPGTDDFMFNGDVSAWKKIAYALKARYYNRLYGHDPTGSANNALQAITNSGMTSSAEDANAIFGTNGNELNQWYAFLLARGGYIKMSEHFINLLTSLNDPRLPFYATTDANGNYTGTPITSQDQTTSDIGAYYASETSIAPLMTYVELKFIEAECNFRLGQADVAAAAFNLAVVSSIEQITGAAAPADYVAAHASETGATITLEKIINQKYIALFTQVESYTDWRRTDYPVLTPNPAGVLPAIPVRYPTSLEERINNSNANVVSDKLLPVWWDVPYPGK
jgi:hypothetical protein